MTNGIGSQGPAVIGGQNGMILTAGGDFDLGRLFARTSSDGAVLRVYGARISSGRPSVPWFTPAPWCFPDRVVQVDASNDLVAGVSNGYLTPQPHGDLAASVQFVGLSEHAPIWVAIVQADHGTSVRATFADGGTDSAPLENGVAVLAHRTTATDTKTITGQGLHVELLGSGGDVVADTTVNAQTPGTYDDQSSAQCVAPTGLPAPGAEQPADVAGATAGVTQAFTDVYNGANSDAVKDAAIDDLDRCRRRAVATAERALRRRGEGRGPARHRRGVPVGDDGRRLVRHRHRRSTRLHRPARRSGVHRRALEGHPRHVLQRREHGGRDLFTAAVDGGRRGSRRETAELGRVDVEELLEVAVQVDDAPLLGR